MLQVWLLGQFEIKLDGRRVVLPARAAQSLLAYLMLSAGTPHRREKLAGLLWSELPEENARRNLRHEVWRIRKALVSPGAPAVEHILADDFILTFNRDADYWLDAAQLQRPETDVESLISSLALYRGELLPGMYDDWVSLERERLQAVYESKMQTLLEKLIEDQRWNTAIEWSERWIAQGQVPEPAYRALMLAHGGLGNRSQVALDYERCVEALRDDLGVEPSSDTRALYEKLTRGDRGETPLATPLPTVLVQPAGTITFLFSDIEGSTKLLERLGDDYAVLLSDQRDLLRGVAEKFNGYEIDTQGDSFFFAFFRAADAVNFASEAQRALAAHHWPQDATLRVRMGLHTGEPMLARTGYVGMDVHRAARIGGAGHGGQVLMSQTTGALVENQLPAGTELKDLGDHRLKDLRYPVHIIQLSIEGLPTDFPPLKAMSGGSEPPAPGDPPFKGLEFFGEKDADLFFGREQLTAKLIRELRANKFLAVVVGASGSGKSSVVRAGVVPALRKGAPLADGSLPPMDSALWAIYTFTPTAHPLEALATVVTRDSDSVLAAATLIDDLTKDPRALHLWLRRMTGDQSSHTLLVVDQFEELFTLCRDEFEREAFIDNLLTALAYGEDGHLTLVLTIRADFYSHLAQYPELREAVASHQEFIGPMTAEELRRAIQEPANRDGWEFEPGLVDLILRDVGDEPGALPLLSHALLETWKRRSGHTLTLKGYHDAGGVHGAIAQTAESVYGQFAPDEQAIVRDLFLRLTELGESTEDTRRRASFEELIPRNESAAKVHAILTRLADARLITLDANSAEVAHEALIREWPQLREWLSQDREGLRLHRQITEDANEWESLERDAGALYRGARLLQASDFAERRPSVLNARERAFLEASAAQEKQEIIEKKEQQQRELLAKEQLLEAEQRRLEQERAANRRLRRRAMILAGVVVVALLAASAALFFLTQSNANLQIANEQRAEADAQRDTAQKARAESEKRQRVALARELAANAIADLEADPERSILLALQGVDATRTHDSLVVREAEEALHRAVQSSRVIRTLSGMTNPNKLAYSPDGSRLAVRGRGMIWIYGSATGEELATISITPGSTDYIAFSADGKQLITIDAPPTKEENITQRIFDVETGAVVRSLMLPVRHMDWMLSAWNPDWTRVAIGQTDGTTRVWDTQTGKEVMRLTGHSDPVETIAYSPDGSLIATTSDDKTAKIWDSKSGGLLQTLSGHTGVVYSVAFSPDGKRLATGSQDGTARIWDVATGKELFKLASGIDWIVSVDFNRDGTWIITVGDLGGARVWDALTGQELMLLAGHTDPLTAGGFNPGAAQAATASRDGTVRIWDTAPAHEVFTVPTGGALSNTEIQQGTVVYSPDGTRLAVGLSDGRIRIGDAETGDQVLEWQGHTAPVHRIAFSRDGTRLASASDDGTAKIWDALSGKQLVEFDKHRKPVISVAFSPDGKRMASGDHEKIVKVWDANTGEELSTLGTPGDGVAFGLTFSPDGSRLAASFNDGVVINWDLKSGQPVFPPFEPTDFSVFNLSFSPDGSRIALANGTGNSRVIDAETGKVIFPLGSAANQITHSPDGKLLAGANVNGKANLWDAATGEEILTLYGNPVGVQSVAFSPDGTRLALASNEDVRVYLLRIQDLIALAKARVTRSLAQEECQKYLHVDQCPQ